jgi:exosortase
VLAVLAALLWAQWPTLAGLAWRWGHDAQYTHGYLVPLFALYLVWFRRDHLGQALLRPSWWGLVPLALGMSLSLAGAYVSLDWLQAFSLLPALAGICLLWGGRAALRGAWTALAFLVFMIPLPYQVEATLARPLQQLATRASTYALQTLGFETVARGNVILLDGQVRIGVVEACNGLSMLVIFVALATAVALVMRGTLIDRIVIVASAVPIALVANVVRIVATGILHETMGQEVADVAFHDLAGWLMMPLALVLMWLEVRVLSWVCMRAPDGSGVAPLLAARDHLGIPVPHPGDRAAAQGASARVTVTS